MICMVLFIYLLGGITFIPILIVSFGFFIYFSSPVVQSSRSLPSFDSIHPSNTAQDKDDDQTKNDFDTELPKLYRVGWLTVRKTFQSTHSSESGYMGLITNSYRNFMDQRSKDSKRARPKDTFYSVLKQNVLFLYQDEDQVDCAAAIQVSLYDVDLYPSGCPDGELFVKRKAICLNPIIQPTPHQSPQNPSQPLRPTNHPDHLHVDHQSNQPGRPSAWFIFTKNNLEKEDWYHILLAASKLSGPTSRATFRKDASLFDPQDMAKLVEGIDQQPDPIPMRWMNAMLGRLFLSAYRTHALEHWIIDRIMKKLAKVQTPNFLSAINVREVNVGSTTPFFSKPMLKELTTDGDASMEVLVDYKGEFRITIETVATINLGARFKPYVVKLVLAVVLKKLSGTLLLKIKKPPTNRLWFGFTSMPELVFDLEPVVSTRQIKWALVLKPIESRIREVVLESIVYPNLDDLVFFDTQPYIHHGGIWGDAARKENTADQNQDDQTSDESGSAEESKSKSYPSSLTHKKSSSEPHHQTDSPFPNASLSTSREENHSHETMRFRTTNKSMNGRGASPELSGSAGDEASDNHSLPLFNQSETKRSSWFSSARRQDTSSTSSSQNSSRIQNKIRPTGQSSDLEDGDAVAKLQKFLRSHPESSSPSPSTPTHDGNASIPHHSHVSPVSEPVDKDPDIPLVPTNPSETSAKTLNGFTQTEAIRSTANLLNDENISGASPLGQASLGRLQSSTSLRRVPPPPRQTLASNFLPPPQRSIPSPTPPPATAANQSTTNSILNQLRTRTADKEAITASVTQARDVVLKWGASWASKRKSTLNHGYPYNSGFNPISIDKVPETEYKSLPQTQSNKASSLTETADTDISTPICQSDLIASKSSTEPHEDDLESHSDRAQHVRATVGKTKGSDQTPNQQSSFSRSDSPTSNDYLSIDSRHKDSSSKSTTLLNLEEVSNSKRNRIFSANGQFIPAAPQSTTGLSIPSTQAEPLPNNPEQNIRLPPIIPDRPTSSTKINLINPEPDPKTEILSEQASYKPAPIMSIPGIKDSSHLFGLGSDSISQLIPNPTLFSASPSTIAEGSGCGDLNHDELYTHEDETMTLKVDDRISQVHRSNVTEGKNDDKLTQTNEKESETDSQEESAGSTETRSKKKEESVLVDQAEQVERLPEQIDRVVFSSHEPEQVLDPGHLSRSRLTDHEFHHTNEQDMRDGIAASSTIPDSNLNASDGDGDLLKPLSKKDDTHDDHDGSNVSEPKLQDSTDTNDRHHQDQFNLNRHPSSDLDPSDASFDPTDIAWGLQD